MVAVLLEPRTTWYILELSPSKAGRLTYMPHQVLETRKGASIARIELLSVRCGERIEVHKSNALSHKAVLVTNQTSLFGTVGVIV